MILKQPSGQHKSMTTIEIRFTCTLASNENSFSIWREYGPCTKTQLCSINSKLVGEKCIA